MNKLVEKYGSEKRWMNWTLVEREGKKTKVPRGSSTDPSTWSAFNDLPSKKGVGIVFTPEQKLLGIDIDHCLKDGNFEHVKKIEIISLIEKAKTYTEISPSGDGLHLFLEIEESLPLIKNRKEPFECYTSGRFFTVTNKPFNNLPVRTVSKDEALDILSIIGYPWGEDKKEEIIIPKKTITHDDHDLLQKMFRSKNGDKIKKLYDGDVSEYAGDESRADMALCSSLAFWTQGDASQMEQIWLSSPLGARAKTQTRKAYRGATIKAALSNCKEFYKPRESKKILDENEKEIRFDFLCRFIGPKKEKVISLCLDNIVRVLAKDPDFKGRFRYDNFKQMMEMKENGSWRPFRDNDAISIQSQISIKFECFQLVSKNMVFDAIIKTMYDNQIDSAADWLRSLEWDGIERLNTWLCKTYGTPCDEYHRKVGSNWLKGLVKRLMHPGCKFDYVLVLEGEQGTKKSSSLGILGGDWHCETTMSTDTKDFFMQFTAKAIVEFSEGETLSRTEVKKMKAIITTQSDKYRAPYERVSLDHPRRCVFAMTTNNEEYLKDETGNRRWLPVHMELPEANIEWLAENREQLYAEAYHRAITLKETVHEFPKEETLAAQEARRVKDPNDDLVYNWYHNDLNYWQRLNGITVHQVYISVLNKGAFGGVRTISRYDQMNIADILKRVLKLKKKETMQDGERAMRWFNEKSMEIEPKEKEKVGQIKIVGWDE